MIKDGDRITIDASKNSLAVDLSDEELSARRKGWKRPPYKADRGTLAKYIRLVKAQRSAVSRTNNCLAVTQESPVSIYASAAGPCR